MDKRVTYSELKEIVESRKMTMKDFCGLIGMSAPGFSSGWERQSISMRYIPFICNVLKITPNRLFGYDDSSLQQNNQQYGLLNTNNQSIYDIDVLKEQIAVKDNQIAVKDKQIE
ncbi:MAG: helix-turn-helix domain-containing protein, partial [Muribaculum sp.]|nr:helix-turn-helix domain-containing protein [Muribaculum sp.]